MGVLDDMTKGITERKTAKAGPKLTPVGTEASPTKPSAILPNDVGPFMSNEALRDAAADLRAKAALLVEVADGLDALVGKTDPLFAAVEEAPKKLTPIEARMKGKDPEPTTAPEPKPDFDAEYAAKSEAAQAATFASLDAGDDDEEDTVGEPHEGNPNTPPAGWKCPIHGAEDLKQLTSRSDRLYMACQVAGCTKFDKG